MGCGGAALTRRQRELAGPRAPASGRRWGVGAQPSRGGSVSGADVQPLDRPRRICFVVQRYGTGVVGGAEKYVEAMATGLAAMGHEISVITSCATSYADWADEFEPGTHV